MEKIDIMGKYGGVRHSGYFSEENPYFSQLTQDNHQSNQDIDALYARAVEWEASNQNLHEQRAYDKQVLEEQRLYDSPAQKLARDKAAGINSELGGGSLSGSSGGSSSAQLAQREIQPTQSDVKFSNSYDNADKIVAGVNAAGNLFSSLSNGFNSIISGIATIKKLPSDIAVSDSQADLMTAQANEIKTLLGTKKEYQNLLNQNQKSGNVVKIAQSLAGLSSFLTPDTDISPILTAMGVSEDDHSAYSSLFKDIQSSPQFVAGHNQAVVGQAKSAAERMVYTQDYFGKIYDLTAKLEEDSLNLQALRTGIQTRIQTILSNSGFAEEIAESQIIGATSQKEAVQHNLDKLRKDITAYSVYIQNQANVYNRALSRVDYLSKKTDKSEREEIEYRFLVESAIPALNAMGSQDTQALNSMISEMRRNAYLSGAASESLQGEDTVLQNLSIYWGDIVNGAYSKLDIAKQWINSVMQFLGVAATAYVGYKVGTKPQLSSQTIIDESPSSYDGTMTTTGRRTIQNLY